MSTLKRKSSVALIIGIIMMLLLIPIWYMLVAPFMMVSELEKLDLVTRYEGTLEYLSELWSVPILITVHVYVEEVKGENIILKMETNSTYMNITLPHVSGNSTYVFNKFTRENLMDAPEADRPREGYDNFYPLHLKAGEDIPNAWIENLNTTTTLEFKESIVEESVTLHKYLAEKTITKEMYVAGIGIRNVTLTATKTILIEPLSGLWVYTENETLYMRDVLGQLNYAEYHSTDEAKAEGLATAKAAYDGIQLLELYVPVILGIIIVVLTIALVYNLRRFKTKSRQNQSLKSPASK
jgi:hypothetical protein